ncbi:RNA 2',3'-cyclic phosphodiesterase [Haloplasma contractile]|uniref:RNA 2',3'-cyclic phosphodiesterase n=1 Tax=Haloplasma contractile SSD-17B TaxID=1033810 RepID=U2FJ85_9MOLU|nr:RNA 2',3'-cyclic phosphodiesterase [Haloplasma contractile]ERJ12915.1 2'-5' RNA ligase protein [Haloplasma contractile SSD-17B]
MRVFLAIEFSDEVKNYLSTVQNTVKIGCKKGNFTLYDHFHLTLRFIGDTDEKGIDHLCDLIDHVSKEFGPFSIRLSDIGSFNKGRKEIVWVGVGDGVIELEQLVNCIEAQIESFGFPRERRKYRPHITIARQVEFKELTVLNQVPVYKEEIKVDTISLMQSHRKNGKLVYTPLYKKTLIENRTSN